MKGSENAEGGPQTQVVLQRQRMFILHVGSPFVQNGDPKRSTQAPLKLSWGILGTVRSPQTQLVRQAVATILIGCGYSFTSLGHTWTKQGMF